MKTVIVKLGGSIITKKDEGKQEINPEILQDLSNQIKRAKMEEEFRLVVIHGAGPFGHVPAKKHKLSQGYIEETQISGLVETRKSMEKLNYKVVKSLISEGLNAISVQPSACVILSDSRISGFFINPIQNMLDMGLIPVSYGDVLMDKKTRFNILSGDQLSTYLAQELSAHIVIMVGDYDGVFKGDPETSEKIDVIDEERFKQLGEKKSSNTDVTGSFHKKLEELIELSKKGIPTKIIGGKIKDSLYDTLVESKNHGTLIKAN